MRSLGVNVALREPFAQVIHPEDTYAIRTKKCALNALLRGTTLLTIPMGEAFFIDPDSLSANPSLMDPTVFPYVALTYIGIGLVADITRVVLRIKNVVSKWIFGEQSRQLSPLERRAEAAAAALAFAEDQLADIRNAALEEAAALHETDRAAVIQEIEAEAALIEAEVTKAAEALREAEAEYREALGALREAEVKQSEKDRAIAFEYEGVYNYGHPPTEWQETGDENLTDQEIREINKRRAEEDAMESEAEVAEGNGAMEGAAVRGRVPHRLGALGVTPSGRKSEAKKLVEEALDFLRKFSPRVTRSRARK